MLWKATHDEPAHHLSVFLHYTTMKHDTLHVVNVVILPSVHRQTSERSMV